MPKSYYWCAHCNWYGPEDDLSEKVSHQKLEFWGMPCWKTDSDPACPECGRDDCLNDAAPPCEMCEERPMKSGYDFCESCVAEMERQEELQAMAINQDRDELIFLGE
jgi:hypothetical protein